MAHEQNIAALLREDAKTIKIRFKPGAQETLYTYICHYDVIPGDVVLVMGNDRMHVVEVVEVDTDVKIEPGSDIRYKWVVQKVDLTEHCANMKRNEEIEELVRTAYQANLRRSFAQQLLSGVDAAAQDSLKKLIGG